MNLDRGALHELAEVVREVSRKSGTILKEDDVVVAVENWRETGDVSKAVEAAVNWIK